MCTTVYPTRDLDFFLVYKLSPSQYTTFPAIFQHVIVTSVSLDRLKTRKVSKSSTQTVLNPRRSRRSLTAAEKATLKEIWARSRAKWTEALEEAQEALRKVALAMQAKVPGHQLDYYIRVITQAITRSTIKPRKCVTKWNTFIAKEACKRNAGE